MPPEQPSFEGREGYVECGICSHLFGHSRDYLSEFADPCPKCGSTIRHITSEPGQGHGITLRFKTSYGEGTPVHRKGRTGASWSHDLQRYVRRDITIDKENDLYDELIVDPLTGEVIHHTRERLSDHQGHGSARSNRVDTE